MPNVDAAQALVQDTLASSMLHVPCICRHDSASSNIEPRRTFAPASSYASKLPVLDRMGTAGSLPVHSPCKPLAEISCPVSAGKLIAYSLPSAHVALQTCRHWRLAASAAALGTEQVPSVAGTVHARSCLPGHRDQIIVEPKIATLTVEFQDAVNRWAFSVKPHTVRHIH